jgi:ABC-type uncharacterized transport system involved in gliding motility auxiliary subunit
MSTPGNESYSTGRRWGGRVNCALAVLSVLALAAMANYLSHRHYTRTSVAENIDLEFSSRTELMLRQLDNEVKVTVFYDEEESTRVLVLELLKKYQHSNPLVRFTSVNPLREPARAREVIRRCRLPAQARNLIIFEANQRMQIVTHGQLTKMDATGRTAKGELVFKRTAFLGELHFTSAINVVSNPVVPRVYFLTGHGEHSATNTGSAGYAKCHRLLKDLGAVVAPLRLNQNTSVPTDCRLLVLAGPQTEIAPTELAKLKQYLENGGRMLLLLSRDSRAGLEYLLESWAVTAHNDVIVDPENTLGDGTLRVQQFMPHPSVRALQRAKVSVRLLMPRGVEANTQSALAPEGIQATPLMVTGPTGSARETGADGPATPMRTGSLSLAVAVEKGAIPGVKAENATRLTRLVVVGDSAFLRNDRIDTDANREFAWHTINWLLNRAALLKGIGPKPIHEYRFEYTKPQKHRMFALLLVILPAGTLLLGAMVWLRRRA